MLETESRTPFMMLGSSNNRAPFPVRCCSKSHCNLMKIALLFSPFAEEKTEAQRRALLKNKTKRTRAVDAKNGNVVSWLIGVCPEKSSRSFLPAYPPSPRLVWHLLQVAYLRVPCSPLSSPHTPCLVSQGRDSTEMTSGASRFLGQEGPKKK